MESLRPAPSEAFNAGVPGLMESLQHGGVSEALMLVSVPHAVKRHGTEAVALHEAIGIQGARLLLAETLATGDVATYDQQRVVIAMHVARQVYGALWFPEKGKDPADNRLQVSVANLASDRIGDCYGFTVLASQALEQVGIDHLIGWANGHSFILLQTGRGDQRPLWFIDPLSPRLSRSLEGMVSLPDLARVEDQLTRHGRAVVRMRTDSFSDPGRPELSFEGLVREHPWMRLDRRPTVDIERSKEARTRLLVSLFPPQAGRAMLYHHAELGRAIASGNVVDAAHHVLAMGSTSPELDARNTDEPRRIKELAIALCKQGNFALAMHAVDAYFSGFGLSDDSRIDVWYGECLRAIADSTNRAIGHVAISAGAEAADEPSVVEPLRVGQAAMAAARASFERARVHYAAASSATRPRHMRDVIAGKLNSLSE